jgi:hypothetical protein
VFESHFGPPCQVFPGLSQPLWWLRFKVPFPCPRYNIYTGSRHYVSGRAAGWLHVHSAPPTLPFRWSLSCTRSILLENCHSPYFWHHHFLRIFGYLGIPHFGSPLGLFCPARVVVVYASNHFPHVWGWVPQYCCSTTLTIPDTWEVAISSLHMGLVFTRGLSM